MRWIDRIAHLPRRVIVIGGFSLILMEGVIAYYLGPLVNLDFAYVIPIAALSWFVGLKSGFLGISLMILLNIHNHFIWKLEYPIPVNLIFWNAISDLLEFSFTAFLLSALKRHIDQLNELAAEDFLTKLPNRRSFYREIRREINRCRRDSVAFSIAYIDVDNFKVVNDTQGHTAGDELLIHFTQILRQNTRASDVISRLGGDEFAILFPETNLQQTRIAIQKIIARLNEAEQSSSQAYTCSMGVIAFHTPMDNLDDMINIADQLMYIAKSNGKNTACFAEFSPPNGFQILS